MINIGIQVSFHILDNTTINCIELKLYYSDCYCKWVIFYIYVCVLKYLFKILLC